MIECVGADGAVLAYIVRAQTPREQTEFVTPPELPIQLGWLVFHAGATVPRHVHLKMERRVHTPSEVLLVTRGRCEVDIYDTDRTVAATHELKEGDVIILVGGGHAFRMLEDTVLLEVKEGPYLGTAEKELF
jgi:cupin fold WbuC family metalloprotein